MSLAKINTVQKARKDQGECDKCKTPLPKGSAYLWFTVGFRSRLKYRRCMKNECYPKPSERESSMMSSIYAAQEELDLEGLDNLDDIRENLQNVVDAIREVAEAYREAGTNPNTGMEFNPDIIERADELDNDADTLEGWEPLNEEPEGCHRHQDGNVSPDWECDDCEDIRQKWLAQCRDEAIEAANEVG